MLYHIIIAMLVLSVLMYGIQLLPLPPVPKRLLMGALVLVTGFTLAQQAGVLR